MGASRSRAEATGAGFTLLSFDATRFIGAIAKLVLVSFLRRTDQLLHFPQLAS